MNPPHDIARCEGRMSTAGLGHAGRVSVTITTGHAECVRCRRREPIEPDTDAPDRGYPHTSPPQFVDGRCPLRIAP